MNKTCPVCKKTFHVKPSHFLRRSCCSGKCYGVWRSQNIVGENNPVYKGGRKTVACPTCGKEFRRAFFGRKYCSEDCANKGRNKSGTRICLYCSKEFSMRGRAKTAKYCSRACSSKYMVGENHPVWLGGKSFEPHPAAFNEPFKRGIRERDNYTCAICKGYGNEVHHIDYCKENTVPKNCITLCKSCHTKTNFRREHWQTLFSKIMAAYS